MRLPETLRAAFVIGRRDFAATVFSKTFLFFLLGPLFPVILGLTFGNIGQKVEENTTPPTIAVIGTQADFDLLSAARRRLSAVQEERPLLELRQTAPEADLDAQRERLMTNENEKLLGVLDGGLAAPHFTGAVNADGRTVKQVILFVDEARRLAILPSVQGQDLKVTLTNSSAGSVALARSITARLGQTILFLLTVLLAGMLLSQLIEEKSNKVIEVLAAAVPVDSIFLGKLFAMLSMSIVGICVWASAGAGAIAIWVNGGVGALPPPAIGWPIFIVLILLYFAMSYLLIGATFLGIGAQASTVREVQTLSMPVTMAQVLIFGFAQLAVGHPNSPEGIGAAVFPLSSPYAMIARAAESPAIWPHLVALLWQMLWVAIILRVAARVFRRSVLKSGKQFRWPIRAWIMTVIAAIGLIKTA